MMWLLRLGLFAVQLDLGIHGSVENLFHAVEFSFLWIQWLVLGPKSWS